MAGSIQPPAEYLDRKTGRHDKVTDAPNKKQS